MNIAKFYEELIASITDIEIRKVARLLSYHVGEENRISLAELTVQVYGEDNDANRRKVRSIISTLVTDYVYPVCGLSGTSGRWVAANKDEALACAREAEKRIRVLNERAQSLRMADLPAAPLEDRARREQMSLL